MEEEEDSGRLVLLEEIQMDSSYNRRLKKIFTKTFTF